MVSKNAFVVLALSAPLIFALPAACTSDGTSSFGEDDGSGTNSGSGGTAGSTGTLDLSSGSGGGGADAPCLAEEAQAEPITLDIVLTVDRSGSMINAGYWNPTVSALNAFFDDPLSAGVNVGLNLFPNPNNGNDCNPSNWNPVFSPAALPLAELNTDAQILKTALANNPSVSGQLTPMYGALDGSYQFAQAQATANPTHKVIVVLAGDGIPEGGFCQSHYGNSSAETIAGCASLAATAWDNGNGIETYTVSISPGVLNTMNQVAAAGGTGMAYDVSSNISAFAQKMAEIRDAALGCEYLIPDDNGEFDPLKVNVEYTPGGGGTPETIPQADNAADCGTAPGWYYDDPINPTKIILCPATCSQVETDATANIKLAFGCPTTVN